MGTSAVDGPLVSYGDLTKIPASLSPTSVVIDPNLDAGPSIFYQGDAIIDPRFVFMKEKVQGYAGSIPSIFNQPTITSASGIPATIATNNIAAAQGVTTAVAMTLASPSFGVVANIPIRVYSTFPGFFGNGTLVTAALALDFGFEYCSTTLGVAAINVNNGTNFYPGMPLVIAAVGNAAGTLPLLTSVVSVAANVVTLLSTAVPLATSAGTPVGTGDIWGLRPDVLLPIPASAYPALAGGSGLFFDGRQGMCRGVQIAGSTNAVGGTFTVRGWDLYGQALSSTVTVAAGASTGFSLKVFKYIQSITPNFTDATHNYTVGTSDLFGFNYRNILFEASQTSWNGSLTATSTGVVAAVQTSPSTAALGDVRGTVQLSTNGPGSAVTGNAATNGTLAGIVVSGRRLYIQQEIQSFDMLTATMNNPVPLFGVNQV